MRCSYRDSTNKHAGRGKLPARWVERYFGRRLHVGPFLLGDGGDGLGQEGDVEGLLEDFGETEVFQVVRIRLVFQGQGQDRGRFVSLVALEVLRNLQAFAA